MSRSIMRYLFSILILVPFFNCAIAQYNLDFGINLGTTNYLGDIGGTAKEGEGGPGNSFIKDINLSQSKFTTGAWIRYNIRPAISLQANFLYLRIGGADSLCDYAPRNGRNLHFRNDIYELSGQVEYHFWKMLDLTKRGRTRLDFGAYVYVGIGYFYHNPKGYYIDKWVALQPLSTEGLGIVNKTDNYKLFQICYPSGIGFYFTTNRNYRIGWEFGYRHTNTDYLDDISNRYVDKSIYADNFDAEKADMAVYMANQSQQAETRFIKNGRDDFPGQNHYGGNSVRGNPLNKDSYIFTALKFSYVVRGKGQFYRSKYRSSSKKRKKRKSRAKF
jgi:hypothetical protein